ncbi:MAG: radical SAM protein [Clostridia bacterium]|nr:radical SAM protein [Clostridia bacterium]
MKKRLYFFQVNYPYGKSAHIPYTAGQLAAYAFEDKDISENYTLEDIFFLRENPAKVMAKIENPFMVAFSTYIWNCNYNKTLARLIKEKYPACIIVFGGHHVSPEGDMLEECPYIDYLLHGEGEIIFRRLMRAAIGLENACAIPGISLRTENGILTNPEMISEECNFPSPYLGGYFDKLLKENPDTEFLGLIETSRGCPNSCAYCDWSNMKSKIRKFPIERIYGEIDWMKDNKIFIFGSADSNFGMFERDEEITDRIVAAKKETGYPARFQTSYAKNSTRRVFDIGLKLERNDLNRGITLSFQSMSDEVLKNICRENISIEYYSELMKLYNDAGIATYTELILGLPGETTESIVDGIDKLLMLGQHNSIYIHNCEWLPCSIMGRKDYVERFGIKTSRIPLNQPHREPDEDDNIPEQSMVVTSTCSMSSEDWKSMNLFCCTVQAFHHMGLLMFFALYLYGEGLCSYKKFYTALLSHFLSDPDTVAGKAIKSVDGFLNSVLREEGTLSCADKRFGNVQWPFEEYTYLCTVYELDKFYDEISDFLSGFGIEKEIFTELMNFQKSMMKRPFDDKKEIRVGYNFIGYFNDIMNGRKAVLRKEESVIRINAKAFESWSEFARVIAWYGRKNGAATYLKEAEKE